LASDLRLTVRPVFYLYILVSQQSVLLTYTLMTKFRTDTMHFFRSQSSLSVRLFQICSTFEKKRAYSLVSFSPDIHGHVSSQRKAQSLLSFPCVDVCSSYISPCLIPTAKPHRSFSCAKLGPYGPIGTTVPIYFISGLLMNARCEANSILSRITSTIKKG
jgi:hypothetical protein